MVGTPLCVSIFFLTDKTTTTFLSLSLSLSARIQDLYLDKCLNFKEGKGVCVFFFLVSIIIQGLAFKPKIKPDFRIVISFQARQTFFGTISFCFYRYFVFHRIKVVIVKIWKIGSFLLIHPKLCEIKIFKSKFIFKNFWHSFEIIKFKTKFV